MKTILSLLSNGPLTYDALRGSRPKEAFDVQLDIARKRDLICKDQEGRWRLRTPPPKDEPIVVMEHRRKHRELQGKMKHCRICGINKDLSYFPKGESGMTRPRCYKCKYRTSKDYKFKNLHKFTDTREQA